MPAARPQLIGFSAALDAPERHTRPHRIRTVSSRDRIKSSPVVPLVLDGAYSQSSVERKVDPDWAERFASLPDGERQAADYASLRDREGQAAEYQVSPVPRRGIWAISLAAVSLFGFLLIATTPDDDIIPTGFIVGFPLFFFAGLAALIMGIVALYGKGRSNHLLGGISVAYVVCMVIGVAVFLALGG
jgi:hypothetical protein